MKNIHSLLLVLTIALVILAMRLAPMILFPPEKKTPDVLVYLSDVMPPAVIGMLIVYCFKGVRLSVYPHGLPELIAAAVTVVLFWWRRSTILSILCATLVYMGLIQFVFV